MEHFPKLIKHLEEKWGEKACPMCHAGEWAISDNVYGLQEANSFKKQKLKRASMPLMALTCDNCGYTILVNTIAAGITPPKEDLDG